MVYLADDGGDLIKKKYLHRIKLINDANVLKLCSEDKMGYQIE